MSFWQWLLSFLFFLWATGFWAGVGLVLLKYGEYYQDYDYWHYTKQREDYYNHDHRWDMIIRNFLFYACLSWYGVYHFIFDKD